MREEVCEEFISLPYLLCLLIGGDVIHVVDLEHMLKVLFPSRAMVFGGQLGGIAGQSPCPTAPLSEVFSGAVVGGMFGVALEGRSLS